jgi:hypothetical protein
VLLPEPLGPTCNAPTAKVIKAKTEFIESYRNLSI